MPPKKTSKKQAKTKAKRALKPVRGRVRRQRRGTEPWPDAYTDVAFATEPAVPINEPRIPRLKLREFFGPEENGTVVPVSENTVDNILKNDPRVQRLIVCEGRRVCVQKEPLERMLADSSVKRFPAAGELFVPPAALAMTERSVSLAQKPCYCAQRK